MLVYLFYGLAPLYKIGHAACSKITPNRGSKVYNLFRDVYSFRSGGYADSAHSFCDVNLVDRGYAAKRGYGYAGKGYVAPAKGYGYGLGYAGYGAG